MANNVKVIIDGKDNTKAAFDQVAASGKHLADQFENLTHIAEGFLGAEVLAKFGELVKGAVEADTAIARLSQKVGMATEFLSGLSYAAQLSEVGVDDLGTGLKKFDQAITAAEQGNKKATDAFHALGISMADLKSKTPEQILMQVAQAFHGAEDGAAKTAIAVALFGRSGTSLIPLLNQGALAIDELRDKAGRLGGVMSSEAAEGAEKLHSIWVDLKTIGLGLTNQFLEGLKPAIDQVVDSMDRANMSGTSWAKKLGNMGSDLTFGLPTEIRMIAAKGMISGLEKELQNGMFSADRPRELVEQQLKEEQQLLAELQASYSKFIGGMHPAPFVAQMATSHGMGNMGLWGVDIGGSSSTPKKKLHLSGEGDDGASETKKIEDAKVKLREAGSQQQITIAKALERAELAQLDLEREQGIITLDAYYKQRRALQENASKDEISALEAKLTAQESHRDALPKGSPERLAVQAEMLKTEGELWDKEYSLAALKSKNDLDELKHKQELKDFLLSAEAEIRTAKGHTLQVTLDAIQKEYDAKKEKAKAAGGSDSDIAGLDMVMRQKMAVATAQNVAAEIDEVYARLDLDLEQVSNAVMNYQMNAMQAEEKVNALRKGAADQVAALTAQYRALAVAAGDPKMLTESDKVANKLNQLRQRSNQLRDAVGQGLTSGFESFFQTLQHGGGAASAFESFAMSIISSIEQMMSKMLAMWMMQQAMGMLFSGASAATSFGGSNLIADGGSSLYDTGSFMDSLPVHGSGGRMAAGEPGIVGDRGPELFVPDSAGTVIPNNQLGSSRSGGSGNVAVTVVNQGTAKNAQASQPQWNEQFKQWHIQVHLSDALNNGPLSSSSKSGS